jgi:UPF0755 protein
MYKMNTGYSRKSKIWLIAAAVVVLLAIGVGIGLRDWYTNNLAPVSKTQTTQYFTVAQGDSVHAIALNLKSAGLIRSASAFQTYARSHELLGQLQAGTYELSPSMSIPNIVGKLTRGEVATNLVTILPGQRLDQIKKTFAKHGYNQTQIDTAFNAATYSDHPLVSSLPQGASLEGLLYPDSFQKSPNTPAETLVRESLDEMRSKITADIQAGFAAQGLNVYQGITLASIVQEEVDLPQYQPTVAQVFLLRLKKGMMLGSDVTAYYAAAQAGQGRNLGVDSPYNTRLHTGLPPGPISNMVQSSLSAVAHPSNSDYLFFVAGDDDKIYFAHTDAEHQANVAKYCHKKCAE